jgi:hypothetical protein
MTDAVRQATVDLISECKTILEEKFRPDRYTSGSMWM